MSPAPIVATTVSELTDVRFNPELEERITELLHRYPTKRAALIPILWLCQDRYGWISPGIIQAVADRLEEAPAFVEGVVTFYTMFFTEPPASFVLQVCTTLSCAVCGGKSLVEHIKAKLGIDFGEKTPDGRFQLVGVQCLGACGGAPVVQINDDYYENLSPERADAIMAELEVNR